MSTRGEKLTIGTLMFLAGVVGGTATTTVAATSYVARVVEKRVEQRVGPLEARQARYDRWMVKSLSALCLRTGTPCEPIYDLIDEPGRP
jgi:hypothetical protein